MKVPCRYRFLQIQANKFEEDRQDLMIRRDLRNDEDVEFELNERIVAL